MRCAMTKTHQIRDDTGRRSSDAQPHGLAASVSENVRHGLDKIRARAFERDDDAAHENLSKMENPMRNVRNFALSRRGPEEDSELEPRSSHVAEVGVREEPSGVLRIGLDLDLKIKGTNVENHQSALAAEEDEDTELGIEDEALDEDEEIHGASDEEEEEDQEDEGVQDRALAAEDEDEEQAEDEDEDSQEDSLIEDEDEDVGSMGEENDELAARPEDDEDLEAAAQDEEPEREEDEERFETADIDDDEELEAGAEDEDEDDLEAGVQNEEEDDLETRDEDEEDDDAEEHPELRSAGDGGSVSSAAARPLNDAAGTARPALHIGREKKPRPATKSQADRVIRIAKHQVGFREGKNNHTKFAAELIKRKVAQSWWQNQPWCETFVAWAFVEAGYRKLAPMTPGCATAIAWFRARKRVNKYPAIGAQVFFGRGGGEHVGLVYKYDPTHIWTIEGNTNDNGSSEGVGVFLKKRARKSAFGYGYPKYAEGIVTADPRKKGKPGFTFKKSASSGARDSAAEPEREEKMLPWVSVRQVQWAAKHSPAAERAAKAGAANPRGDVKLVQEALTKVLGVRSKDPAGIFEKDTQRLFHRFRTRKLKFPDIRPSAAPGAKGLTALGRLSKLFRVRTGSMPQVDDHAGSTTPARLSPRDVTFKRCTIASTPDNISMWIRQACKKSGATPSSAWVRGYKTIIKRESGGNPNACNVWDSNAKTPPGFKKVKDFGDGYTRNGIVRLRGRPTHFQCSRGIVQCIPQTFAAHHARGTSRSIYDPVASIAASIRYVRGRYNVAKDGSNLARKVQQADPTRPPKGY
jgi:hypothetical protein